ncbi:hypothetical protein Trco_002178 [Trichoderma cornu-damae]|uniref:Uncharacterized protein n=1 Tax=Trichoderma cornu-damae TaxID=654480 RepID=A0A9P8QUI9_9HYPO|nr:hypothetical protein Trco_002178 [Trichoderma cornu-damae]
MLTFQRTTRLHDLDLQYQHNRHKTDLISREENARQLQLRVLLFQDENAQLRDNFAVKDAEVEALSRNNDRLRVELDEIKAQNSSTKDALIKGPATEVAGSTVGHLQNQRRHKVFANKAKTVGIEESEIPIRDLKKALEENVVLAKELQQLRPEIELLRLQVTNYENMISEQGGLQRQQGHLDGELASKKHSKSKGLNGESKDVIELQSRLDETTEKVAEGERQRERMRLDHQKELDEFQRQKHKLEERVSALEKQLKASQAELHDMRKGLQASRSSLTEDTPGEGIASSQGPTARSRNADQSPTAEKERLPRKKPARKRATEQAMVGEKSTFSITPFLNKTKDYTLDTASEATRLGLALDDMLAQAEHDNPSPLQMTNKPDTKPTMTGKSRLKTLEAQSKSKEKGETTRETSLSKPTVPNQDTEKVKSEDAKDEEDSKTFDSTKETAPPKRIKIHETTTADRGFEFEQKKRKRKLLNKVNNTIIEEDEAEDGAQPMETQPGRARKLKSSAGNAFNARSTGSTFSPLKRHRRGVNASFLV